MEFFSFHRSLQHNWLVHIHSTKPVQQASIWIPVWTDLSTHQCKYSLKNKWIIRKLCGFCNDKRRALVSFCVHFCLKIGLFLKISCVIVMTPWNFPFFCIELPLKSTIFSSNFGITPWTSNYFYSNSLEFSLDNLSRFLHLFWKIPFNEMAFFDYLFLILFIFNYVIFLVSIWLSTKAWLTWRC